MLKLSFLRVTSVPPCAAAMLRVSRSISGPASSIIMRRAINLLTVCCCSLPLFGAEYRATPATLDVISTNVQPGDTVVLADGVYTTALRPARSGTAGVPIVYRAANARKSVFKVDLEAKKPAIELSNLSHITIDGVMVMNAWRFIMAEGAAYITINNCHFENTRGHMGWENCRFRSVGDGIRLTNNLFMITSTRASFSADTRRR